MGKMDGSVSKLLAVQTQRNDFGFLAPMKKLGAVTCAWEVNTGQPV